MLLNSPVFNESILSSKTVLFSHFARTNRCVYDPIHTFCCFVKNFVPVDPLRQFIPLSRQHAVVYTKMIFFCFVVCLGRRSIGSAR